MLSELLKLLRARGALSVEEISLAQGVDPGALRPMLELLEHKGKVIRVEIPCGKACAGGCRESDKMTFYKISDD